MQAPQGAAAVRLPCRSGKYGLQLTSPIGKQSVLAEPRSLMLSTHVSSFTWKGYDPDLAGAPTQGGGTRTPVGTYSVGRQGHKVFRDCRRLQEISQVRPHSPWGPPPGTVTLLPLEKPRPWVGPTAPSPSPAAHRHRLLLWSAAARTNPADPGAGCAGELE